MPAAPTATDLKPLWRRAWIWPVGLLLLLVVAFGVCESQGWPFLKGPAERQLTARLQRPVEFGDSFTLHLLHRIRLSTSAFRIGARQGSAALPGEGDLAQARAAYLELPYSTVFGLLRGDAGTAPRITSLRFAQSAT